MSSRYEIQLASGVGIWLVGLMQHYTYGGLMEGFPIRRLNKRLVSEALTDAGEWPYCVGTPFLLPPVETPLGYPKEDWIHPSPEFEPVRLPSITCLATFDSPTPARDAKADMSSLTLVWYQNELAMPIDPEIIQAIRALDWRAHAKDGWY